VGAENHSAVNQAAVDADCTLDLLCDCLAPVGGAYKAYVLTAGKTVHTPRPGDCTKCQICTVDAANSGLTHTPMTTDCTRCIVPTCASHTIPIPGAEHVWADWHTGTCKNCDVEFVLNGTQDIYGFIFEGNNTKVKFFDGGAGIELIGTGNVSITGVEKLLSGTITLIGVDLTLMGAGLYLSPSLVFTKGTGTASTVIDLSKAQFAAGNLFDFGRSVSSRYDTTGINWVDAFDLAPGSILKLTFTQTAEFITGVRNYYNSKLVIPNPDPLLQKGCNYSISLITALNKILSDASYPYVITNGYDGEMELLLTNNATTALLNIDHSGGDGFNAELEYRWTGLGRFSFFVVKYKVLF
jgi:hypothetical protein